MKVVEVETAPWAEREGFRNNNFDVLRLFLSLLVIYSHSYPLAGGALSSDRLARWTGGQIDCGYWAVNAFFVISGFLIARSWERANSNGLYLRKRIARIVPGFVVAMTFSAFVAAPLGSRPWAAAFSELQIVKVACRTVLLTKYPALPTIFSRNPFPNDVNGSMWTIQFEFLCYVLLAIAGTLGLLKDRWLFLIIFAASIVILAYTNREPEHLPRWNWTAEKLLGSLSLWPRLITYFAAGTAFYLWRHTIPHNGSLIWVALAFLVAGLWFRVLDIIAPCCATYTLFWIAFHPRICFHRFGKYGDFSYGTYLYAFPIQQLVVFYLGPIEPVVLFFCAAPLSIVAGVTSWYAIEERFLRHSAAGKRFDGVSGTPGTLAKLH